MEEEENKQEATQPNLVLGVENVTLEIEGSVKISMTSARYDVTELGGLILQMKEKVFQNNGSKKPQEYHK